MVTRHASKVPSAERLASILWFAAALAGCASEEGGTFGSGGSSYDYGSDDTATSGGDDTGSESNPDAPVITAMRAGFEDYPNIGFLLEIGISYTDANDDVDGGQLILGFEDEASGDGSEFTTDIGGEFAYIDSSGEIILAVDGVDSGLDYTVTAVIRDVAGNSSGASSASTAD